MMNTLASGSQRRRRLFINFALVLVFASAMLTPIVIATFSPFLAYRTATHIVAGFAGMLCLALFAVQPLLVGGYLTMFSLVTLRKWHRWLGSVIVVLVVLHVGGLFLVSPADALDALLFSAPTPFSIYGVLAMWGIVATIVMVVLRRRLRLSYRTWRNIHNAFALLVVAATAVHALQIEGAMEVVSKWFLCLAVLIETGTALLEQRIVRPWLRRRARRRYTATT